MLFSFILHFYSLDKAWTSKNVDAYLIVLFSVFLCSLPPTYQYSSMRSEAFSHIFFLHFNFKLNLNSEQRYSLYILGAMQVRLLIC